MEVEDYEGHRALVDLIEKITSSRQEFVDAGLLQRIKSACKSSDKNIKDIFDLLYTKLGKPNSQVRLLALEVCAELFNRSKYFRTLVASKFTNFVELVVGFKVQTPLPGPTAAAERLRQRALELIELWNTQHGSRHRQISLGYSYIKDTLKFAFPEVDARRATAEAEQRQREETAQRLAQERYHRLLEDWPQQSDDIGSVLLQISEAFVLLEELRGGGHTAAAAPGSPNYNNANKDDEIDDDLGWEDLKTEHNKVAAHDIGVGGGLSSYAPEVAAAEELDPEVAEALLGNETDVDAVVEVLDGLYKSLCNQTLPALQEALRTIVRADGGEPGEARHTERERFLRSVTELKTQVTAAKERYESGSLHLRALVLAHQRRQKAAQLDTTAAPSSAEEPPDRERAASAVEDFNGGALVANPYQYINDPAAPRKQQNIHKRLPSVTTQTTSQPRSTVPSESTLPASVRAALAAQAPVLPAGAFVRVWDSDAPPVYVSGHAMEVSNHWGPVDVHQELPEDRMDEYFLIASRERYPPVVAQGAQGSGSGSRLVNQRGAVIVAGQTPGGRSTSSRQPEQESSQLPQVNDPARRGMTLLHGSSAGAGRAQRAAERAYNNAVISGAAADEQVARALQDAEGGTGGSASQVAGNKREAKKKVPVRERLKRKLLSGGAVAAAMNDAAYTESERRRENFSNRWEDK